MLNLLLGSAYVRCFVKKKENISNSNLCVLNYFTYRLARLTEEDFRKAEDFINLMKVLYTPTLCVSSENSPTCGQILPILKKLEAHLAVNEGDTVFVSNLKKQVWANLSKRYQVSDRGRAPGKKLF